MSSVLIKGMKMPSECRECPFVGYYWQSGNTQCDAKPMIIAHDFKPIAFDGRHPDCPLVEIPPHGRLIDADELLKKMNLAISMMSGMMKALGAEDDAELQMGLKSYRDIRDGINEEPTIIEAEEEQEE